MTPGVLITHKNCLDGSLAAVLGRESGVIDQVIYTDYSTNDKLAVMEINADRDRPLYIVDMSVSLETADAINASGRLVILIDHHKTALPLKQYTWANVDTAKCGSALFYDFLIRNGHEEIVKYEDLVSIVNDHDMWIRKDPRSDNMALLLEAFGQGWVVNAMEKSADYDHLIGDPKTTQSIIDAMRKNREYYIRKVVSHSSVVTDSSGNRVAITLCTRHHSEAGHEVVEKTGTDYVILVDSQTRKIGLRSAGKVDVGEIAGAFGGGGHPGAAGIPGPYYTKYMNWLEMMYPGIEATLLGCSV